MKIACISISSSDDAIDNLTEDLSDNDGHDYITLSQQSWVQCEFCDRIFDSRFALIQHNASHIIIPLVKQTHQCPACLRHFTNEEDLNMHIVEKHKKAKEKTQSGIDILQSIVEKEVFVKCHDDFKDVFCHINKQIIGNKDITNSSHEMESISNSNLKENEKVRNRLLFEEDEHLIELKDLSSSCEPINSFQNERLQLSQNVLNSDIDYQKPIQLHDEAKSQEIDNNIEVYSTTIHYDDLIEENEVACRFCGKIFPNRFEILKHEPKHLRLRRFRYIVCGFCDTYISGNYRNLRRHIDSRHPGKNYNKFNLHKCQKCQLPYFNYSKHYDLYHVIYKCQKCRRGFEKEEELYTHTCISVIHNGSDTSHCASDRNEAKMMKLCEMCYSFMKSYIQNRQNYIEMGELSEIGVRQICDKCNNKFFVVKLVKRESLVKEPLRHKVKGLSNADRLKRMQNRLKMMQHRNKF